MARLHSTSTQKEIYDFPIKTNEDIDKYCSNALTLQLFGEELSRSIQAILSPKFIIGDLVVCHGDLHAKNILLKKDGFIFIDPDPKIECSHWDIARLLSSFVGCPDRANIFDQITEGYCSIRKICPNALRLFYVAILVKKFIKSDSAKSIKAKVFFDELKRVVIYGTI